MSHISTVVISKPGVRVVVVNKGLKGDVGGTGPAGSMTGPVGATDAAIALFDGATGNVLKDSTVLLSSLITLAAANAALANKEDKVAGKGLSQNDFTNALKAKVDGLTTGVFRGAFATKVALDAALPTGTSGDYAIVEDTGETLLTYFWDATNTTWTPTQDSALTGAEIATLLFAEPNVNPFTDTEKTKLASAATKTEIDDAVAQVTALLNAQANNVVSETTTARTIAVVDSGLYIRLTNAAGCTLTLPNDATGVFATNLEVEFRIATATLPTITLGGGVTLNNSGALAGLAEHDTFKLKRIGADAWDLII